jgi:hypothetical protein
VFALATQELPVFSLGFPARPADYAAFLDIHHGASPLFVFFEGGGHADLTRDTPAASGDSAEFSASSATTARGSRASKSTPPVSPAGGWTTSNTASSRSRPRPCCSRRRASGWFSVGARAVELGARDVARSPLSAASARDWNAFFPCMILARDKAAICALARR